MIKLDILSNIDFFLIIPASVHYVKLFCSFTQILLNVLLFIFMQSCKILSFYFPTRIHVDLPKIARYFDYSSVAFS